MKKLSVFFATVLFAAMGFASCSKDNGGSTNDDNDNGDGNSGGDNVPRVTQIVCESNSIHDGDGYSYTTKLSYDSQGRVINVSSDSGYITDTYTYSYGNGKITVKEISKYDDDLNGSQSYETQNIATLDAGGRVSQIIHQYDDESYTTDIRYDSGGYMQEASSVYGGGNYIWSGVNITSTKAYGFGYSAGYTSVITYTDKTYTGNLFLEYLTYVIESAGEICVDTQPFGLLGFCGQRCANLPLKVVRTYSDPNYYGVETITYSYTFNNDGTVKTITENYDDGGNDNRTDVITFSYE